VKNRQWFLIPDSFWMLRLVSTTMKEMLVRNPLKDFAFVSSLSLSLSLSNSSTLHDTEVPEAVVFL
jgi:hypothetical protein